MAWHEDSEYLVTLARDINRLLKYLNCFNEDLDDLVQEVLIALYQDPELQNKPAPLFREGADYNKSWLYRRCRWVMGDYIRKQKKFRYKNEAEKRQDALGINLDDGESNKTWTTKTVQLESDKDVLEVLEQQNMHNTSNAIEQAAIDESIVTLFYDKLLRVSETILLTVSDSHEREFYRCMLWDINTHKPTAIELAKSCGFTKAQPNSYFSRFANKVENKLLKDEQISIKILPKMLHMASKIKDSKAI